MSRFKFDMNSFGSLLPENWKTAIEVLNEKLGLSEDDDERIERIWEEYCYGFYDDEIKSRG